MFNLRFYKLQAGTNNLDQVMYKATNVFVTDKGQVAKIK